MRHVWVKRGRSDVCQHCGSVRRYVKGVRGGIKVQYLVSGGEPTDLPSECSRSGESTRNVAEKKVLLVAQGFSSNAPGNQMQFCCSDPPLMRLEQAAAYLAFPSTDAFLDAVKRSEIAGSIRDGTWLTSDLMKYVGCLKRTRDCSSVVSTVEANQGKLS